MKIVSVKENLDISKITLGNPGRIQGGSHYSKLFYNNDSFYLRVDSCLSKNGIVNGSKKSHIDLLFSIHESEYIDYFSAIEKRLKEILTKHSSDWFSNQIDQDCVSNGTLQLQVGHARLRWPA